MPGMTSDMAETISFYRSALCGASQAAECTESVTPLPSRVTVLGSITPQVQALGVLPGVAINYPASRAEDTCGALYGGAHGACAIQAGLPDQASLERSAPEKPF